MLEVYATALLLTVKVSTLVSEESILVGQRLSHVIFLALILCIDTAQSSIMPQVYAAHSAIQYTRCLF